MRLPEFHSVRGQHWSAPIWLLAILIVLACVPRFLAAQPTDRIVSVGGSITEIIYALGEQDRLVARDTTSKFPVAALDLPDVGYIRNLASEGVLSVQPSMIITEDGAGPPETIEVLQGAAIPMITIPDAYSHAGIVAKIIAVGDALGVPEKARDLAQQVDADLNAVRASVETTSEKSKTVLFILSTNGGRITASGTSTAADGIIQMAGGRNAITSFEGYKQLTAEAIAAAAPDVILMMDRSGDHSATADDLFKMPALITTPAAANRALVQMNGLLLLGFGPRTPQAAEQLNTAIYGAG
ncbi:MAG: iron complex transport system substrate-binding protein [Ascidiaceihabitans sp.]|jgi:iron complex transport system substrate-binding protein